MKVELGRKKMSIEEAKEVVARCKKEAADAYSLYTELKWPLQMAQEDWLKKARRFKDFDYQLALVDGRLKKVVSKKEEKAKPKLTLLDLQKIAKALGVELEEEENEEEKEIEDEEA